MMRTDEVDVYPRGVHLMNKDDQKRIIRYYLRAEKECGIQVGWTYKWLYNQMWNGVLVTEAINRQINSSGVVGEIQH